MANLLPTLPLPGDQVTPVKSIKESYRLEPVLGVKRRVIDLGFGVAIIDKNRAPADDELNGAIMLTLVTPEDADGNAAKSIEFWHHDGLVDLRDALSTAIAEREEELELNRKEIAPRG